MSDNRINTSQLFPVKRSEWAFAIVVAVLTAVLLILPYVLGHQLARPGTMYTGLLINVEDGTYLSAIEQGRSGSWSYRNLFTAENHDPVFIQGFYLALGHMARLLGLTTMAMWHLALFTVNLLLFLTLFTFAAYFLPSPPQRRVAYLLALFGSGFDLFPFPAWFERAAAMDAVPVTLHMPEAHIFSSALTYPHFVAGITLILTVLGLTFLALTLPVNDARRWPLALFAGLGNLLLAVVYPFLIILITAVLGAFFLYLLWREQRLLWREAALLLLIFLIPFPLYLYYQSVLAANPVMQAWNAQAVTLSPNPLHYLLTYAPYPILALPGLTAMRHLATGRRQKIVFLWIWVAAVALLLYMPLNPQRRFVQAVQIPLAILATVGLFEIVLPRLMHSRLLASLVQQPRYSIAGVQRLLIVTLIAVSSLVNFYLLAGATITLAVVQPYPFFRAHTEVEAMQWLRRQTFPEDVVLAAYWTGSYLPYQSGNRVVVGQRYETVHFETKREAVRQYFTLATDDEWRRALLEDQEVAYIFAGRAERNLGAFDPAAVDYLELIFQNEQVAIYRVSR